jgi:hypothetical protein
MAHDHPGPVGHLDARSRRPGLAHEELELSLGALASVVHAAARAEQLPNELWSVIAIESEHALLTVSKEQQERVALAASLDALARCAPHNRRGETRLHEWAAALRHPLAASPRPAATRTTVLELIVPYHSLTAWRLAAEQDSLAVRQWARDLLARAGPHRALWEAAAAESGHTLGHWVALGARGS